MGNCKSSASGARSDKVNNWKVTLALFGLDNAGKTVTAKGLLGEPVETATPTIGFSSISIPFGKQDVTLFDLGGGRNIRGIWKNYFAEIHGMIFVVDASAPARLEECKKTLCELIRDDMIKGKPLLLLANKQDLSGAMDEVDICEQLQLEDLVNVYRTPCRVESCSAAMRKNKRIDESIQTGFRWLMGMVEENWKELNGRVTKDLEAKEKRDRLEREARAERVRQSRELRETENGFEARRREEMEKEEEEEEEEEVAGNPFRPINQLKSTQEKTKKRKSTTPEDDKKARPWDLMKVHKDLAEERISRPTALLQHRSYRELETRPRNSRSLQRTFSRSNSKSDTEDEERPRFPNARSDSEDESLAPTPHRRKNQLEQIPPTRIRNNSNTSDTDDNSLHQQNSPQAVVFQRAFVTRTVTPPVPLRLTEAGNFSRANHFTTQRTALAPLDKETQKRKKKKKTRFNQTAPIPLDPPENWGKELSSSTGDNHFHSYSIHQKPPSGHHIMTRSSPVLLQNTRFREKFPSVGTNSEKEDESDKGDFPPMERREIPFNRRLGGFNRMRPNYGFHTDSNADDDDDIII